KFGNFKKKPKSSEYEIIYAIISKSEKDLDIPFFSKINIRNAKRRLETFGYSVSLLKISIISETD
ncbi:TIGR04141 family sporadically distributed protein, partial [bacterium]|nr:TIGR04141 family sporadically distributed protein [bacterium]